MNTSSIPCETLQTFVGSPSESMLRSSISKESSQRSNAQLGKSSPTVLRRLCRHLSHRCHRQCSEKNLGKKSLWSEESSSERSATETDASTSINADPVLQGVKRTARDGLTNITLEELKVNEQNDVNEQRSSSSLPSMSTNNATATLTLTNAQKVFLSLEQALLTYEQIVDSNDDEGAVAAGRIQLHDSPMKNRNDGVPLTVNLGVTTASGDLIDCDDDDDPTSGKETTETDSPDTTETELRISSPVAASSPSIESDRDKEEDIESKTPTQSVPPRRHVPVRRIVRSYSEANRITRQNINRLAPRSRPGIQKQTSMKAMNQVMYSYDAIVAPDFLREQSGETFSGW